MHSPSGSQGRISQLIREERIVVDPDLDQNLQLLHLTSLCENVELSENSLNRFRIDSEETASIDSSNPGSPSSPNFLKYRPSNISISTQNSSLRHTQLQRTSFFPDRKRKNDVFFEDDLDRLSAIRNSTRSTSPSYISPRSISPMGECRSAPQSPLCRLSTWEPTGIRRPHSSKSITDRDSLSSSSYSILSPYNSTECLIQAPKLIIAARDHPDIENVQKFTPNSNEAFIYPDKMQDESIPTPPIINRVQNRKRVTTSRLRIRNKYIRVRTPRTDNFPLISTGESVETNLTKRRRIE